jgi:hypothetical protein
MKNTEIYTYSRIDLNNNLVILAEETKNNIKYKQENSIAPIYLPNSNVKAGVINFINNLVISDEDSFNTSIGTIVSKNGSIVFNFNYIAKFFDTRPDIGEVLTAKPTYVSGNYSNYKDLTISVQILKLNGERIIAIEYN